MAFDAGTIMARLDLDEQSFDRKLKAAQDKKEKFEKDQINLKVGDVFGGQQEAQARKMFTQLDQQVSRDAISRMKSGSGSLLGTLMAITTPGLSGAPSAQQVAKQGLLGKVTSSMTGRNSGGGDSGGGGLIGRISFGLGGGGNGRGGFFANGGPGNKGFGSGLFNGIGPGVLGLGTRAAGIIGGGASLLGALPAAGAIGAGVGVLGAGVGGLLAGSKQLQAQAKTMLAGLKSTFQSAAQPLVKPLEAAFSQIPKFLKSIQPELHALFAGAAPLMKPLLDGLESLVKGLLPGLVAILHAGQPAFTVFAQILGMLGRDIGGLFKAFAPAISASSTILKALAGVLGGLLPIIGKLAAVFASALAPVFVRLASVIKDLEPILVIVGKVFASLATAILGDLVSAFFALAKLLTDISPALKIVASTLSSVFTVLENSGVFAVLGDALEAIVPILAKLINTLVQQLAPVLPILITLIAQFANIMIDLLAAGLTTILTGILLLIKHFPFLVPLLGAATAAFLLFNLALDANPIGLVILAIGALVGAGTLLVKHWAQVWGDIKKWAADAWNFISNGFGKYLLPLLGPAGLIAFGAIELSKHWHSILHAIESDADSMWQHLVGWGDDIKKLFTSTIPGWWDDFTGFTRRDLWDPFKNGVDDVIGYVRRNLVQPIENIFTSTIPNAFRTAVRLISNAWGDVENAVRRPVKWVVDNVINGLITAFDWISGKVGGPHINAVHPMGLATGGRIPGYGGGDRHLTLLEGGEAVIDKVTTARNAETLRRWGVPGFARGGKVGQNPPTGNPHLPQGEANPNPGGNPIGGILGKIGDAGKILAAVFSGNTTALSNAITAMIPGAAGHGVADMGKVLEDIPRTLIKDAVKTLIGLGGLGADAGEIVKYAMSFIGRIPYVWGGTNVPGGADCSGFVQAIYKHFGISAPRTSEAQGAWVRRGAPTPGGLAFYHSPAGGPDPGHVGIVRNANSVISQGGGMGPQVIPLHALPLLWTGVPPGGLGAGGNINGTAQKVARTLLARHGWGSQWGAFNSLETQEAGWNLHAQNPGSGAYGMAQFIKGASEYAQYGGNASTITGQLTAMMNYIGQRYGNPDAAWAHEQSAGWYDGGGWLKGGLSVKRTHRPEAVLNPGQSAAFLALAQAATQSKGGGLGDTSGIESRLERVIRAIEGSSARTGGAMADVLNGAARKAAYKSAYSARG